MELKVVTSTRRLPESPVYLLVSINTSRTSSLAKVEMVILMLRRFRTRIQNS